MTTFRPPFGHPFWGSWRGDQRPASSDGHDPRIPPYAPLGHHILTQSWPHVLRVSRPLIPWVQNGHFLGIPGLEIDLDMSISTWRSQDPTSGSQDPTLSNRDPHDLTTQNDRFSTPFLTPFFGVREGLSTWWYHVQKGNHYPQGNAQ